MIRARRNKNSGNTVFWIVLFITAAGLAFLFFKKSPIKAEQVVQTAAPTPAEPEPTPIPEATLEETPTPEPTPEMAVETPIPTPTPEPPRLLTLQDVAQDRSIWPREIALTKVTQFPAMLNGQVIGTLGKPAGSILRVVNITAAGVDILFNNAATRIPATSTDLLARAEKLRPKDQSVPALTSALEASHAIAGSPPVPPPPSEIKTSFLSASKLIIEMIRAKKSRIEGGDYDDKIDHIQMKVKVTNPDPRIPTDALKGTVYIFADSILERSRHVLLGRSSFDCRLDPRGQINFTSDEFECFYDTTDARFGYKYSGWVLELKDSNGRSVFTKVSSPTFEKAVPALPTIKDKGLYDKDFKYKSRVNPNQRTIG